MAVVVPNSPVPRTVIVAVLADFVAGAIYGVLGGLIVAIATGLREMPDGYALSPGMTWLMGPTGAMMLLLGLGLVFTGVQLFRGREWIRPVQWILSIPLAILAFLGIIDGHDSLCTIKLICAVVPMAVLRLRHVRAWFDSPYVRTERARPPLAASPPLAAETAGPPMTGR